MDFSRANGARSRGITLHCGFAALSVLPLGCSARHECSLIGAESGVVVHFDRGVVPTAAPVALEVCVNRQCRTHIYDRVGPTIAWSIPMPRTPKCATRGAPALVGCSTLRLVTPPEEHRCLLSVRGEAQRTVMPDQVSIFCAVAALEQSTSAARAAAARAVSAVTEALAGEGGEALSIETARAPLTWSVQSIRTRAEYAHNKVTGEHGPTGRYRASASLLVAVRDFALLPQVEATLTSADEIEIHAVDWLVDHDNAGWATVRAEAIHAALLKGQDYAAALGGSIVSVDHIADAGLLAGDTPGLGVRQATRGMSLTAGGEAEAASLDLQPQILTATIEARLTANITGLAPH